MLFPLQFSFAVPKAQGFNGLLQAALLGFDKPYNQAPSLHISLLLVLWVCYAKKLTGAWILVLHVWFFAIAASVLLVYQHHFIDVWTGAIAGLIVLYALPNKPNYWRWQKPLKSNINIGLRYLFGSIILGFLAYQLFPIIGFWVVFIDWLALSLCLVALAYVGFNQHIFQRHNGYISWPAKCLLAPYLLLSYISYLVYTQKIAPFSQITEHVYLGCFPSGHQQPTFTTVIDLTNEFVRPAFIKATNIKTITSAKPHTYYFPMLDLVPSNPKMLVKAVLCLHNQQQNAQITPKILVHCALGLSRSACVVVTWLVWQHKASSMTAAITQVKEKRAGVVITEQHIAHMQQALAILNKRP